MSLDPVHQLIYSSAAVTPFTDRELATLLMRARATNARLGVSGLLLYHEGSFLQMLEGGEHAVNALFSTISLDKRHNRIVSLLCRKVDKRHFPEWEMGFVSETNVLKSLPGYSEYLLVRGQPTAAGNAAASLLSAFREGRFRSHVAA